MREGTITEASFKLELQAPQLRPEAFPWGSADVDIHAIVNNTGTQGCRRVISLPGVMDLSALVFAGEKANDHSELSYSLGVEIVGYDHGITFALGNAFIPLPPSTRQSSSVSKSQFRVSVTGEEGVRNGTLVGNIQACGPAGDNPEAGEAVGVRASKFYPRPADGDVRQESGGEADDVRRAHDGVAAEEASKEEHGRLEGEAIELLEAAMKILASPSSCVGPPARPSGGPAARISTHESTNESTCHCRDELRERRVLQVPPPDTSGDVNVGDPGSTVGSALSSKEEDELPISPRFPTAGFKFEPTTGNVEWQRIASVNVSKVEREGDLQTLRQFLPDVAVGMVDEDDFDANPGLVNAFRLAQLQTQYVLHCSQLLQRQCDRLETAVASMELETKGNSQGSTALKSRARLLRKERRKQDKIIVGYAAMLRTHNPGLSSKVFLDKNGRLKVHKKASRHRERERRRTNKRRNRGCRDDERETLENKMYNANNFGSRSGTGTEGPTLDSPGDSNDRFPEAGGPPPEFGIQRPRSRNAGTRTSSVAEEDEWSAFRLDPGEDDTASRIERDQTIRARRSDGNTMMPRRRRRTTDTADEGHARMSDDDVVHVSSRDGTRKSPAGAFEPHGSESGAHVVVTCTGIGTFGSDSDGWAGVDPDNDGEPSRMLGARSVSQARGNGNSNEDGPSSGERKSRDRTPRVVAVSVKPKRNQSPASASSQEQSTSASPQRHGCRPESTNNIRDTDISGRNQGIDGKNALPVTPGVAAARETISLTEKTARITGELSSGGVGDNSAEISLQRGLLAIDTEMSAPRPSAPVAAASQLGLEGDGFPDVSEFDLDDISEIDAGAEWAGSDRGGSLSS